MKKTLLLIFPILALFSSLCAQVEYIPSEAAEVKEIIKDPNAPLELRIFPNPAVHYFRISANREIGQVRIINIIGKKVKIYEGLDDRRYDIEDLPMGIYLVQILDDKGKIMTTRRLSKRMP
jgi:hypothetical protein